MSLREIVAQAFTVLLVIKASSLGKMEMYGYRQECSQNGTFGLRLS
jgi:hypothetical protein